MTHTIQVLPIDIECGVPYNATSCPIAHAVRRSFPDKRIHVGSKILVIDDKIIELPKVASTFVSEFDGKKVVKPISFGVNL
jgi:hypothetical protein